MSIEELMRIVKPPRTAKEPGDKKAWAELEKDFGLHLPSDWRDLGLHYGTGRFYGTFIHIYNPFSDKDRKYVDCECDVLRDLKQDGLNVPYNIHPDNPGLLPWGGDE